MFEKMMKKEKAWELYCEWIKHNSSFNFNEIIQEFQYGFEYSVDERDFNIIFLLMLFFFDEHGIIIDVFPSKSFRKPWTFNIYNSEFDKIFVIKSDEILSYQFKSRQDAIIKSREKAFEILEANRCQKK